MKRYFDHLDDLAAIKAEYKRLCKINHPDVGGDTATMQDINGQYSQAVERMKHSGNEYNQKAAAAEVPMEFIKAVAAIINLERVNVDLVGLWLWVTGDTYQHKDALKKAGYKWASKKQAWYWHPENAGVARGSRKSLAEIKVKYGSARIVAGAADTAKTAQQFLGDGSKPKKGGKPAPKRKPRSRKASAGQVAMEF